MKHILPFITFVLTLVFAKPACSQQELAIHFMDSLWQQQKTNPAFSPVDGFVFALPSLYSSLSLPASYNDLVVRTDNNRKIIDGDKLIDFAKEKNTVLIYREIESFSVGIPVETFQFSLSHAAREYKYWNFTKSALEMVWLGNASFVGETVPVTVDMHTLYYHELALGINKKWGKWRVGGKFKLLAGAGDVSSEKNQITLQTDSDIYQLNLNTDYRLNTAGRLQADSLQNIRFSVVPYRIADAFSKNPGWAMDLGLQFQPNNQLSLSLSVLDIGQIRWKENVQNFISKGNFNFDGLEIDNLLRLDSFNIEQILDTIDQVFAFQQNNDPYTTTLPTRIFLSASYKINKKWQLTLLSYSEILRGNLFQSIAAGARHRLSNWLSLGVSYAWRDNRFDNIGINGMITLGPFQFYGATDTFLAPFAPLDVAHGNTRIGLNVLF